MEEKRISDELDQGFMNSLYFKGICEFSGCGLAAEYRGGPNEFPRLSCRNHATDFSQNWNDILGNPIERTISGPRVLLMYTNSWRFVPKEETKTPDFFERFFPGSPANMTVAFSHEVMEFAVTLAKNGIAANSIYDAIISGYRRGPELNYNRQFMDSFRQFWLFISRSILSTS